MSKPSRRLGTCAFCGQFGQLTREDFTPRWIGRFIANRWPPEGRAELVSIAFGGDQPYREKSRIVGNASAIKPVVVCARCNNEWMKHLEDVVIPILTPMMLGQQLVLDEAALAALGAWVTKTALVFELVQRDSDATASAADRLWFKNHRVPLGGSRIWAARYVGAFGKSWQARSTLFTYNLDDPTSVPSPHGLVAVLAYGEVAFRVAMVRSAPALPTRFAVTESVHAPTIWPATGPLSWPPARALDDDGLLAFGGLHVPATGPGMLDHIGPPPAR